MGLLNRPDQGGARRGWAASLATARALAAVLAASVPAVAGTGLVARQDVPLEYQVKAVYLFNFVKFVQWPPRASDGPITICVAEQNPFDTALNDALRGEQIDGRPIESRVIDAPDAGCSVVFVPRGAAAAPYLEAARGSATLTVGEDEAFLREGGIINFILERGRVRFEIDRDAADRADLRISAHLLRLSRTPGSRG